MVLSKSLASLSPLILVAVKALAKLTPRATGKLTVTSSPSAELTKIFKRALL